LDNKFDVTILTTLFVWLKESGFVPNRDLVIAFTGDEESFQETVQQLARDHRDLVDAEYALVVDGGGGVLNDTGEAIQFQVGFRGKNLRDVFHDRQKPRRAQLDAAGGQRHI
jgi:acetylornithine deacetylase/succinyl-diaminopimelate desuccinylase-like protein